MFAADFRRIATTDGNLDSMEDHSLTTDLDFDDYMQPPAKQNEILP